MAEAPVSHSSLLENIVQEYKIFIDTCSLCNNGFEDFSKKFFPVLKKHKKQLIVPYRVAEELIKLTKKPDKDLKLLATESYRKLAYYQKEGLIIIQGEKNDNFADNVFQVQFTKFRMQHKLVLITQDKGLATDILNLNNSNSVNGRDVKVFRINAKGFLGPNLGRDYQCLKENFNGKQVDEKQDLNTDSRDGSESIFKFAVKKKPTSLKDDRVSTYHSPKSGDTVSTLSHGDVALIEEPKRGGEGCVYSTNKDNLVCKIYHPEKLTRRKLEKLKLMLDSGVNIQGICWPVDVALNREGIPVGYLMPKATGKELQKSLFIPPLMRKNFPAWKRVDLVELAINILEKISYLHSCNIIIGDINPANILINDKKEVYFVDTDSYQIEEFPCPVGKITFTAPEIQRTHFKDFLRSVGNERFAVATLLFMLMLPGKNPYAQQGGENLTDNIIKMDFSYPFGPNSNKKTPDGPWRFCWSHLPYNIKERFYETFRKGGKYSTEDTRISTSDWIALFKEYFYLLKSGKFGEQDKMSEEIFPDRFKQIKGIAYKECRICNKQFPEEQLHEGICSSCLNDGNEVKCSRCGNLFLFNNYQKYIKKANYTVCYDCFKEQESFFSSENCVECGKKFSITVREKNYFEAKGFDLPKRCEECRRARKEAKSITTPQSNSGSIYTGRSTVKKPPVEGFGGFFEKLFSLFGKH